MAPESSPSSSPSTANPPSTTAPATAAAVVGEQANNAVTAMEEQRILRTATGTDTDTDMITTATATPNSPPLPARHTAATPGPRASRFRDVLDSSLSHTLAKISWDNFASCYPTIAGRAPGVLKAVQKQMVERLGALCQKEFDSVMHSRNVVAKLNELESLVSEAERRRDETGLAGGGGDPPIPPHMLPASQILSAHLAPHLASQQSQLNARLQTTQAHNAKLYAEVTRQRAEIVSLVNLLEKVLEDVDGANDLMDGVVDELAVETRGMEVEMG